MAEETSPKKGEKLTQTLKGKIGPVPVWVIALVVVAGLSFILWRRTNKTDTTGQEDNPAVMIPQAGPMPTYGGDTYYSITNPVQPQKQTTPVQRTPTPGDVYRGQHHPPQRTVGDIPLEHTPPVGRVSRITSDDSPLASRMPTTRMFIPG